MNDFQFILEDILFNKRVKLTEDDYFNLKLALSSASMVFNESGTLEHRKKSREFLRLRDKI